MNIYFFVFPLARQVQQSAELWSSAGGELNIRVLCTFRASIAAAGASSRQLFLSTRDLCYACVREWRVCACVCVSSMSSCLFLFACHKLQVTWQAADAAPAVVEMLMLTCLFPWAHETNEREHTHKTHTHAHILTHTGRKKVTHTQSWQHKIWKQKPETESKLELNWSAWPMRRMRNERLALGSYIAEIH